MFSVMARPFVLEPHRALVDDLDVGVGVECFVQPVVARLTSLVGQVTLEIEHLAFAADLVGDELAALLRRGDVVGLDQTDDVSSGWGGIDGRSPEYQRVFAASMPGTMPAASTVPRMMPSYFWVTASSI